MLPNESLLVMLQFADYKTLLAAKFTGRRFLRLVAKYAAELGCQRSFHVAFYANEIVCDDMTTSAHRSVGYEPYRTKSLEAACREVAGAIGPHTLDKLTFHWSTWNMYGVRVIFEAAAPLKHANEVVLYSSGGATIWSHFESFMSNFVVLKSLDMHIKEDVFHHFSWKFLRLESAREVRRITVDDRPSGYRYTTASENMKCSVEKLVRDCITPPRPRDEGPLELDFSHTIFPEAFGLRIIELLRDSVREMTFRMMTLRDAGRLTRDTITFCSADEVPQKKPRVGNDDVVPVMPSDKQ